MVPVPLPAWQVLQVRVVARLMCLLCAPAMLGKVPLVGPLGRPAPPTWQERQVPVPRPAAVGLPRVWQTLHSGAEATGLAPVCAWQLEQSLAKVVLVVLKCPFPWVSVCPATKGTG